MPANSPDLPAIAGLLQRYEVECVLVGGMSAVLHGSTVTTKDIDTVPLWTRANLERLCAALNTVDAEIMVRSSPDGDPANEQYRRFPGGLDYDDIRHIGNFRVRTSGGERIDVLQSIPLEAGDGGYRASYAELAEAAITARVTDDIAVQVMSRDHLIRSKSAIGRPHDVAVVRQLREADSPTADPTSPTALPPAPVFPRRTNQPPDQQPPLPSTERGCER